jgi:hypothetical protein
MLSALAVSGYIVPPPLLAVDAGSPLARGGDFVKRLPALWEGQARAHATLKEQRDRFDKLFEQAHELSATPTELRELASEVRSRELQAAEILRPRIEGLHSRLSNPKANVDTPMMRSWRRLAEESLEIGIAWLELYQNLQIRLFKLASDLESLEHPPSKVLSTREEVDDHLQRLMVE